jgi:hypothetical protein
MAHSRKKVRERRATSRRATPALALEELERRTLLAGPEFVVNTATAGAQVEPHAAMGSAGHVAVVWRNGVDGHIYLQRYNATGAAQGANLQVSVANTPQSDPHVAIDGDGDIMVVWTGQGTGLDVFARNVDNTGAFVGDPFVVNNTTAGDQSNADVAMDLDGDAVVVWEGDGNLDFGIYSRRFSAARGIAPTESRVDDPPTDPDVTITPSDPTVAMDDDGDTVVAWKDERTEYVTKRECYTYDGQRYCYDYSYDEFQSANIVAKRFTTARAARGAVPTVLVATETHEEMPFGDVDVAMDGDGDFFVGWLKNQYEIKRTRYCEYGECYTYEELIFKGTKFFGRRFTATTARARETATELASTDATRAITSGSVALARDGRLVAAWINDAYDSDEPPRVEARRFNTANQPLGAVVAVNTNATGAAESVAAGADAGGNFLVGWQGDGAAANPDVFARLFDSPRPDLVAQFKKAPKKILKGKSISVVIRNNGAEVANGQITVQLVRSTDAVIGNEDDALLGTATVTLTNLGAGQASKPVKVKITQPFDPGNYHVIARADTTNAIVEEDETNNGVISANAVPA